MLSNPLHRFSPYHSMPQSTLMSNGHPGHHMNGLDTLAQGSHYALQQLQQHVGVHNPHLARPGPQQKHRQHPYGPSGRSASASGPIRRRISRACDQCNQLRTKCDGQHPCAHCIEFGLGCEYIRERKKRGKASRKDLAQQAAAQAAAAQNGGKSPSQSNDQGEGRNDSVSTMKSSSNDQAANGSEKGLNDIHEDAMERSQRTGSMDSMSEMGGHQPHMTSHHPGSMDRDHLDSPTALDLNGYGNVHSAYDRQQMTSHMMGGGPNAPYGSNQGHMSSYPDLPYALQTQSPTAYSGNPGNSFRLGTSPLSAYPMAGEPASPGWMNMSSPPAQYTSHVPQNNFGHPQLRYPVLEPLIPHLGNLMPVSLACDLIDLYFASSSSAQMHPMSPYVLGFVFRKRSFLHPTKPRQCQPALLASMLWVAAQTSDAPFLASVPSARGKICQKLLELTVSLLKPLIHTPSGDVSPVSSPIVDGVALGGLGVALPGSISMDALTGESGAFGAAGTLDDVVTYIHLATVVSASEYKGASIRWWNAAWSLARELKLSRELPQNAPSMQPHHRHDMDADRDVEEELGAPGVITEEEREERRRIWWLVYIVDRHLALCYNRPLFLLDIECEGLLQPMDDTAWQNGEFYHPYSTDPNVLASDPTGGQQSLRPKGPTFECTGHSIFGYFLPLMTILGEIVDLHHARNHPRFGVAFRSSREWEEQTAEIVRHLEAYERSLKMFEQRHMRSVNQQHGGEDKTNNNDDGSMPHDIGTPSVHSVHSVRTNSSRMTESDIQTRIVFAYGTHVMHVLHILLTGKWDPINLLDDNDLWISSQGFITATGHAVSAAEAISHILEFDPGLEFMPFFFGIYLLQGSFLLLLIADKLQSEASPSVVKACETIIRAHEACVVTLNTEYQRNFSRVMRSALAQVRGRVPEDLGEQHQRRRELLALYRWTGDGTGLAL
ncbi:fungal-specific transcription factor domain-containing protein [Coniochaeta sp. 2T2.1]|nr:fungal-specific transcription factor domain-containing protein [Coniochaeta sp. 2T2.1]